MSEGITREMSRLLQAGISLGLQVTLEQLLSRLTPETRESLLKELRELDLQIPESDVVAPLLKEASDTSSID